MLTLDNDSWDDEPTLDPFKDDSADLDQKLEAFVQGAQSLAALAGDVNVGTLSLPTSAALTDALTRLGGVPSKSYFSVGDRERLTRESSTLIRRGGMYIYACKPARPCTDEELAVLEEQEALF